MFKPRIIKKVVHRKTCIRCHWFERMSPFSRNRDACPECRGELLFYRGVVTTQTNALFFWRELAFEPIMPHNEEERLAMENEWMKSPVWLE